MVNRQPSAPNSTRNNSVRTAADIDGGTTDDYAYTFVGIDGCAADGGSAQYNPNPTASSTNSRTNRNSGAAAAAAAATGGEPSSCRNSVTSRGGGGGRSGYASPSEGEGEGADDDALVLICMDCGAEILRKSTPALCKVSGRLHV